MIALRISLLISFLLLIGQNLCGQDLDHERLIEQLRNSQDDLYNSILLQYENHLSDNPNDISILISRCKFVQNAMYDEYDDYNPNQEYFDSLATELIKAYPENEDVLLYHSSFKWGEELDEILDNAEEAIKQSPGKWTDKNKGSIFFRKAQEAYNDDLLSLANTYIKKAYSYDQQLESSILHARILIALEMNDDALNVLLLDSLNKDLSAWEMTQKANLFMSLKEYSKALDIFQQVDNIDSTYNDNTDLASTLENVGEYDMARVYLLRDTASSWYQQVSYLGLFLHDVEYQEDSLAYQSYVALRSLGYSSDPLGIYRLKLFFNHPFLPWKFNHFGGPLVLILVIAVLVLLPSIWVLPVYTIGHKWKLVNQLNQRELYWGLKSFWWVSFGYLIASFVVLLIEPEYLNSLVNWTEYEEELTQEKIGLQVVLFISLLGGFGFLTLSKTNIITFMPTYWDISKSIGMAVGIFVAYKVVLSIYIIIGTRVFGWDVGNLAVGTNLVMAVREDIVALLATYGKGAGIFIVAFIVPVYEELIFRGVILDSCERYIGFKWANIFQAFLFALIHQNLVYFPAFFAFAIIVGLFRKRSNGLLAGIIFHIINNLLAAAVLSSRLM